MADDKLSYEEYYAMWLKKTNRLTIQEILDYEVHSNWLAAWISFSWGQEIMGWYIAQKVKRKYKRYKQSLENRERLIKAGKLNAY